MSKTKVGYPVCREYSLQNDVSIVTIEKNIIFAELLHSVQYARFIWRKYVLNKAQIDTDFPKSPI